MHIYILLGLILVCFCNIHFAESGKCSTVKSKIVYYQTVHARQVGHKYYTKCGSWKWKRCTKWRYTTTYSSSTSSKVQYYTDTYCCPGWSGVDCNMAICNATCANGGTCTSPDHCTCKTGFASPDCKDIDECSINNGGCQHKCNNTIGSFICSCSPGHRLSGKSCPAICNTDVGCLNGGTCISPNDCACRPGFIRPWCEDIDECAINNGGCEKQCHNVIGGYSCSCKDGFQVVPTDKLKCEDINECKLATSTCARECSNTLGSYKCKCKKGYECIDVDECKHLNGGCSQFCNNTYRSFHCYCGPGFRLKPDGKTCTAPLPTDCSDNTSFTGVKLISPEGQNPFKVYCSGGCVYVARRFVGNISFYKPWSKYKEGFGDVDGEHFIGLDNLHSLLKQKKHKLRIDLSMWPPQSESRYAEYSTFDVGDEGDHYRLTVDKYSGDAGDSLTSHDGLPFSTKNQNNKDCAKDHKGAWWYDNCWDSNLFGIYNEDGHECPGRKCMSWYKWPKQIGEPNNAYYSFKKMDMKVCPL